MDSLALNFCSTKPPSTFNSTSSECSLQLVDISRPLSLFAYVLHPSSPSHAGCRTQKKSFKVPFGWPPLRSTWWRCCCCRSHRFEVQYPFRILLFLPSSLCVKCCSKWSWSCIVSGLMSRWSHFIHLTLPKSKFRLINSESQTFSILKS